MNDSIRAIAASLLAVSDAAPPTGPSAIQAVLYDAGARLDALPRTPELERISAAMHATTWCEAHSLTWCCLQAARYAAMLLIEADAIDRRRGGDVVPMMRAFSAGVGR